MLVIADQRACGIGRKRCLARAGEAEENRGVVGGAHVGRAMHGHHALFGQQVVQNGEDGFLDLARILRAADENEAIGEI